MSAQAAQMKGSSVINDNVYVGFNAGMFEAIKKNLIKVLKALKNKIREYTQARFKLEESLSQAITEK